MATSPAFPLSWRSELVGEVAVVVVEGELDRLTTPALRDHLEWLLAWIPGRLEIDAAGVTFADAGAHAMLTDLVDDSGHRGAPPSPCEVVLSATSPSLRRVFAVLGTPVGVTLAS
jgi:anti-anti-sigma regulatory factor